MQKYKHFIIVTVLVLLTTVVLKYVVFGPMFRLPPAASAESAPIDALFEGHFWVISFLFALIMVLMLYAIVVFRRKSGDETDGPHVHGNTTLEIVWTIVPVFVVIGFAVWGMVALGQLLQEKDDEMVVVVTGKQWEWSFAYPEQGVKAAQLVLPVNQPILLEMYSPDVLHSFWVPEFRVKQDLVPGRPTFLRITPTEIGNYKLLCAEICGMEHANMVADVRVVDNATFLAWMEERSQRIDYAALTPVERGALWYGPEGDGGFGCNSCHSLDGSVIVGPSWLGLYGSTRVFDNGTTAVADDEYIRNSIFYPGQQVVQGFVNQMPNNYEELFAAQEADILLNDGLEIDIVADLIAFIRSLNE